MVRKNITLYITLIFCLVFIFLFPGKARAGLSEEKGFIYCHGDENVNKIAITFDDGPNPPYTEEILQILDENGIKATFFLLGRHVAAHPELAKKILEKGHAVGNHTYDHPDFRVVLEWDRVEKEIKKCEKTFADILGYKTNMFRPPFSCSSKNVAKRAAELGYISIGWSVRPRDGSSTRLKAETIVKRVISKTQNGSIILLHDGDFFKDGQNRSELVKAARIIIADLKQKGFQFVTVPELLGLNAKR